MRKVLFFIFIQSFILGMIVAPIRGYDFHWSSFVGFLAFYVYTWFALYKYGEKIKLGYMPWLILLGLGIIEIPLRIVSFSNTVISLPDFILRFSGVLLAYFTYGCRRTMQIFSLGVAIVFNVFMSTHLFSAMSGWEMWVHYINTDNFTPTVQSLPLDENVWKEAQNNQQVSLYEHRKGKITLIDFWVEKCGYCWKGFPAFQQFYDKYKNHPEVMVCSIYAAYKDDQNVGTAARLLSQKGYTFPVYGIQSTSPILEKLDIRGYPCMVLLDKQGRVILNFNAANWEDLLEKEIEKLLYSSE